MIPKINQDLDSTRHQRNMTQTQKRNDSNIKEGVIVNSFVKDPLLSLDETCDALIISNTNIDLPEKVFEKETKEKNPLIPLCIATVGVMGLLGGFTAMMKRFSKGKLETSKEYLLPGITRNHCINDEVHQSIFSMIQSPNRKTILASLGVITLGSMAFMGKIFIDGFRDVWVKKQEADIQKNLQESLIEVETQKITFVKVIVIQILSNLLFTFGVIFITTPDFQLYNILFSKIVYNNICSFLITSLGFNIIITRTIDNWSKVQKKKFSSVFFFELI